MGALGRVVNHRGQGSPRRVTDGQIDGRVNRRSHPAVMMITSSLYCSAHRA